jgi:hypothetical protein
MYHNRAYNRRSVQRLKDVFQDIKNGLTARFRRLFPEDPHE